jgi:hypothetical protein
MSGIFDTIIAFIWRWRDKRERRIERFVDGFQRLYKDGVKLEILIPAGINNMRNDKEIALAFEALMTVIPGHPLRGNWRPRVEKVGYKRFFDRVAESGKILNIESIETFLRELE